MKILICGKGGSGKSTVSAILAKNLTDCGYSVLLVDADESNLGLHRLIGAPLPVNIMENLGGKKSFKQKLNNTFPDSDRPFSQKIKIHELPEECISRSNGVKLVTIGKIHGFGEGCACPMGVLSKMVLSSLVTEDNEVIIIDTEAGIEHFGRQVDAECDLILAVVDPTFESFMLAEKIDTMAEKAGKKNLFILNKTNDSIIDIMMEKIDSKKVIAKIPQDDEIFAKSLEGSSLESKLAEINAICRLIDDHKRSK